MKRIFNLLICCPLIGYELSIGAIFQNEAPYLKEWIEFHKLVGVEHFYLYQNGSVDDYKSILNPYIENGEVELVEWPLAATGWEHWLYVVQASAYADCIQRATHKTKWLALIDIDEFLTPISSDNVPSILKDYEEFGGVGFNWKIFGHSGYFDQPQNQLMIETLVMTAPPERITQLGTKSIVRPECVQDCKHPHYVVFKEGYFEVDSNRERTIDSDGSSVAVYYDRLAINHYWSRTGSNLYNKLRRYQTWFPQIEPDKWPEYVKGMNEVRDHSMERFVKTLRKKMGLDLNLDDFLLEKGFRLTPAGSVIDEGYVTQTQKEFYIEELKKHPDIQKVAEVGFNAGHTAEIFLETLEKGRVVSFDINSHYYTDFAVDFFEDKYQDRFKFVEGDSLVSIPQYFQENPNEKFDLIYVDGCHLFTACFADIANFKNLADKNTILWVDDTNFPEVKRAVDLAERLQIIQVLNHKTTKDEIGTRAWVEARYLFKD